MAVLASSAVLSLTPGCGDDTAKHNEQWQRQAQARAALLTDCALVIPALSRARTEHDKTLKRDEFSRTGFEIQALLARAKQLGCPVATG